jgi:DNA (cytosine-5)-methyltransferase 1
MTYNRSKPEAHESPTAASVESTAGLPDSRNKNAHAATVAATCADTGAAIRFFDMFSGIGGFRAGLERVGGFECVGHCEIDKHADAAYKALHNVKESEIYYDDATTIDTNTLPEFDLLCAGFPCQSFSIAGKRKGFSDPRGTMFFEIARVARARRPTYLLLENVPGLLSHDKGRTFAAILRVLCDLGYSCEWQVLNSKNFGVPQSRRRVYVVGYLDRRCAGKILPVREANAAALIQLLGGRQDLRVYDPRGVSKTLLAKAGGPGGMTGLYAMGYEGFKEKDTHAHDKSILFIKEATSRGYAEAMPGDSIDISYANTNTRRGRVGSGIAHTLDTGSSQGVMTSKGQIRRLMPRECLRLQGFSEEQIDRILSVSSDAQAYKQAGNAVTVNVVHELGSRLKAAHVATRGATSAMKEACI